MNAGNTRASTAELSKHGAIAERFIGSVVQEPPACSLGIDDSSEPVGQREFARLLYIFVKAATEADRQVAEPITGTHEIIAS